MPIENAFPRRLRRLSLRQPGYNGYFLTVCTAERVPVLANERTHERFRIFSADSLERYGFWVDNYVLMPDHLHVIVTVSSNAVNVGEWVKALKAVTSKREFRWQNGFFDHLLRSDESRSEKWEYIRMNPVRKGLVNSPENWPYAGAFHRNTGQAL